MVLKKRPGDQSMATDKREIVKIRRRHCRSTMPGQIVPPAAAGQPAIRIIAYGPSDFIKKENVDLATISDLHAKYPVIWIDVEEFGDADLLIDSVSSSVCTGWRWKI